MDLIISCMGIWQNVKLFYISAMLQLGEILIESVGMKKMALLYFDSQCSVMWWTDLRIIWHQTDVEFVMTALPVRSAIDQEQ